MLIGEVAQQSGISARMLRHYDRIGLVRPSGRTAGGYREYSEADLRRLFHVEGLRSLGLALQEIASVLDGVSFSPAAMVEELIAATRERLEREQELLRRLSWVRASEPTAWSDALRTIGMLRGLDSGDPRMRQRLALSLTVDGHDAAALAEVLLEEPETNVAGTFDWVLARTGDRGIEVLVEALGADESHRRRRAVAALTKIGTPAAAAALAEAFRHADLDLRAPALLARGGQGRADAIPGLVGLVVEGRSDVEAADVLGSLAARHGHAEAIVVALDAALGRGDAAARRRLVGALAEVPGEGAVATLSRLAADADPGVAHTARYLLQQR
jgi:DNA-binding transcriptional MerR regulator